MSTDHRLQRLERQCSLFKAGFALVTVALAAVLFVGAGQDKDKPKVLDEVRAKNFILVDKQGKQRGMMPCDRSGVRLGLLYSNGREALRIVVREDKIRTGTVSIDQYNTDLRMFDAVTGRASVRLNTTNGGRTRFRLDDPSNRNPTWIDLKVPHGSDPEIIVMDKSGKVIFKAPE